MGQHCCCSWAVILCTTQSCTPTAMSCNTCVSLSTVSEAEAGSKAAELPFHAPNVWPDPASAPLFKPAFTAYRNVLLTVRDK